MKKKPRKTSQLYFCKQAICAIMRDKQTLSFFKAHKNYDKEFARDVPQYKKDCLLIAEVFRKIEKAYRLIK
jgi:hypothetical protein